MTPAPWRGPPRHWPTATPPASSPAPACCWPPPSSSPSPSPPAAPSAPLRPPTRPGASPPDGRIPPHLHLTDCGAPMDHSMHHDRPTGPALTRLAGSATLHCLIGCAIGEVLGMVIG